MKVADYTLSVPSGVRFNWEDPFIQVKDREAHGYNLIGIQTGVAYSESEQDQFVDFLTDRHHITLGFNMGGVYGNMPKETYEGIIQSVSNLRKRLGDQISPELGMKFQSMLDPQTRVLDDKNIRANINSPMTFEEYRGRLNGCIFIMDEFNALTKKHDLILNPEVHPRPDYMNLANNTSIEPDPYGRFSQGWAVHPTFMGLPFANAKEIVMIMSGFDNAKMQLDIEHLSQTVEAGSFLNYEDSTNGIRHFGSLTNEQQRTLINSFGWEYHEDDILFDYSNMTDDETIFMEQFGYVVRQDQPPIYNQPLSLEGELQLLEKSRVPISSVNIGFQTSRGVVLTIDGRPRHIINSHKPGITEPYVTDDQVRKKMLKDIKFTYELVVAFMERNGIDEVEYEPYCNTDREKENKLVYDGPVWNEQAEIALKQMDELIIEAKNRRPPHFIMSR